MPFAVAEYHVIDESEADGGRRLFERLREPMVVLGRGGIAGRMVVGDQNPRRLLAQRELDNFAR